MTSRSEIDEKVSPALVAGLVYSTAAPAYSDRGGSYDLGLPIIPSTIDSPEAQLVGAIIEDAWNLAVRYRDSHRPSFRRDAAEADAWLRGCKVDWPRFSLDAACSFLGVDPAALQKQYLSVTSFTRIRRVVRKVRKQIGAD